MAYFLDLTKTGKNSVNLIGLIAHSEIQSILYEGAEEKREEIPQIGKMFR